MARYAPHLRNPQLHDAVLADPDDDAPRLVYADWLSERGDPWGELITVQITRTRAPTPELEARERELLSAVPGLGQYRRGFVEIVSCTGDQLEDFLVDSCVRSLQVTSSERIGARIAAAVPRMRLKTLWLTTTSDFDVLLQALDDRLEALTYGYSFPIPTEQIVAMRRSALRLSSLALQGISPDALGVLAGWHPLKALSLEHNPIGAGVFEAYVDEPAFARLERLELSSTQVGEEDVFTIASSEMPLVELGLSSCTLGSAVARRIAQTPRFAALRKLRLADCEIGSEGLEALVASPYLSRDLEITLDGDLLGLEGQLYYDGDVVASHEWRGQIPERVASRFHVTIEGIPRER